MSKAVKEKIRKVFLEDLPRDKSGNKIAWSQSEGYIIKFIHDDIEGELEIIGYDSGNRLLKIKYLKGLFDIFTGDLQSCAICRLLGKRTSDFKVEIGDVFDDGDRNMIIIDKEYRKSQVDIHNVKWKWYKYCCNICGYNGWIVESGLITKKHKCLCCDNKIVSMGINDIPTTAPWMIPYFQGGYDEAKLYTRRSAKKIYPICPDCGRIKDKPMAISTINNSHGISCICTDGYKYPEKFMFNVLVQLNINFTVQLTQTTFKWVSNKYKYDFYLPSLNIIIETHGLQHYKNSSGVFVKTLEEEQENDECKKQLALTNGIKEDNYIVIDCRKSEMEFIKQNIINSRISELFDLSIIDWKQCEEFALSNRVKEACDLWNSGMNSAVDIGVSMKIDKSTVRNYLKKGQPLGWCNYNTKEENEKSKQNASNMKRKPVLCLENYEVFESSEKLEIKSEEIFGIKLSSRGVALSCRTKQTKYKGFTFKYISKEEYKNRINNKEDIN